MAGSAEAAGEDVLRAQAGGEKLRAIGLAKIEMDILRRRLMTRGLHVEPLQGIGLFAGAGLIEIAGSIGELRGEFWHQLRTHFITAGPDGRTESRKQIRRFAVELEPHAANRFFGDAGQRATPAGVHSSDSAILWIDKQNGHAIRRLHGQEQAWSVCGGGVAFAGLGRLRRKQTNEVRMDLLHRGEHEVSRPDRGLEQAAVFRDIFLCIPLQETEVEHLLVVECADAPRARAKTVDQPGKFLEGGKLQNLQAARLAEYPRSRNRAPQSRAVPWLTTPALLR